MKSIFSVVGGFVCFLRFVCLFLALLLTMLLKKNTNLGAVSVIYFKHCWSLQNYSLFYKHLPIGAAWKENQSSNNSHLFRLWRFLLIVTFLVCFVLRGSFFQTPLWLLCSMTLQLFVPGLHVKLDVKGCSHLTKNMTSSKVIRIGHYLPFLCHNKTSAKIRSFQWQTACFE